MEQEGARIGNPSKGKTFQGPKDLEALMIGAGRRAQGGEREEEILLYLSFGGQVSGKRYWKNGIVEALFINFV